MGVLEKRVSSLDKQTKRALPSETIVPGLMPQILTTWDMTNFFVLSVYLAPCITIVTNTGPAALTYLLLASIFFFLPCLLSTAQLARLFPFEGALYNWTHRALGGYWSFFAGFCAWLPCVLLISCQANLFINYAYTLFYFGQLEPWMQGILITLVLIGSCIIATQRLSLIRRLLQILIVMMFFGTVCIGLAALLWVLQGHHLGVDFSNLSAWEPGPGNMVAFAVLAVAYMGVEGPLNLAGETTQRRFIKPHLLIGGILIFAIYLIHLSSVLVVEGTRAAHEPLAQVKIVALTLGEPFASLTAFCMIASVFATLLAYHHIYARLFLVAGIDKRLPARARILNKQQVPANAMYFHTFLATVFTIVTFVIGPLFSQNLSLFTFANKVYDVTLAAATLLWTVSTAFLFINLIGCYHHYRDYLRQNRIMPLLLLWIIVALGLGSCGFIIIDTLCFSWNSLIPNSRWWYLVGSLMFVSLIISAFSSMIAKSEVAWQEFRTSMTETHKTRSLPR